MMDAVRTMLIDGESTGTVLVILRLGLVVMVLGGDEIVLVAEAGAGDVPLVLLAILADLGEVQGVVRQPVLHVPVPERRHGHPPVALLLQPPPKKGKKTIS